MSDSFLFTSESVGEGHPDKVSDQISDAVLDAMLEGDPRSRVACETMVTTGVAIVAGEITTTAVVDIPDLVRSAIRSIGYKAEHGFDGDFGSGAIWVPRALDRGSGLLPERKPDLPVGDTDGQRAGGCGVGELRGGQGEFRAPEEDRGQLNI